MRLLLTALLVLLSPGLPAYQALAADFSARNGQPLRPAALTAPASSPKTKTLGLAPAAATYVPAATLNHGVQLPSFTPSSPAMIGIPVTPAGLVSPLSADPAGPSEPGEGAKKAVSDAAREVSQPGADPEKVLQNLYDARAKKGSDAPTPAVDGSKPAAGPAATPLSPSTGEAQTDAPAQVPAPATAPAPDAAAPAETAKPWYKSWLGLGFMPAMFVVSAGIYQIGYESLGIGMQKAGQVVLGSVNYIAQLAVVRIFASMAGSIIAPIVIDKLGLRNAYWMSMGAQMAVVLTMTAMLVWGFPVITLPLLGIQLSSPLAWLALLYGLSGFLGGITYTAHDSIITLLFKQDQAKLERFGTIEHMLLEILAVPTPIVVGLIVVSFGFLPAILAYPIAMFVALMVVLLGVKFPEMDKAVRKADDLHKTGDEPRKENALVGYWKQLTRGAVVVWKNVPLRITFVAYALYMMFNFFIYYLLAATYGQAVAGDAWPSVQGFITGLYSGGGLVVTIMMLFESAKLARMRAPKDGSNPITAAQETEMLRQSMLRWMKWGTIGLVTFGAFLIPMAPLGALVTLPAWLSSVHFFTLPAIAMFLYGIPQVAANLKMSYFFKARIPDEKDIPAANGFFRAGTNLIYTLGLMGMSELFKGYEGLAAFKPFMIFVAVVAALYVALTWALDKATKPSK